MPPETRRQQAGGGSTQVPAAPLAVTLLRRQPGTYTGKTRTNPQQTQILIEFIEKHGDLTLPKNGVRMSAQHRKAIWDRLSRALNAASDLGAPHRPNAKWQKVWSDLKNNTRKKALKMASSPGETNVHLSQSEYRVLKIMGMIKSSILSNAPPPLVTAGAGRKSACAQPNPEPKPEYDAEQNNFTTTFESKLENPLSDSESEAGPEMSNLEEDMFSWPQTPSPQHLTPPPTLQPPQRKRSHRSPDCVIVNESPPSEECILEGTVMDDNSVVLDPSVSADATLLRLAESPRAERSKPSALPLLGPSPGVRPDVRGHTVARESGRGAKARGKGGAVRRLTSELARTRRMRGRELRLQRGWQSICERGLTLIERFLSQQTPGLAPAPAPPPPPLIATVEDHPLAQFLVPNPASYSSDN